MTYATVTLDFDILGVPVVVEAEIETDGDDFDVLDVRLSNIDYDGFAWSANLTGLFERSNDLREALFKRAIDEIEETQAEQRLERMLERSLDRD